MFSDIPNSNCINPSDDPINNYRLPLSSLLSSTEYKAHGVNDLHL